MDKDEVMGTYSMEELIPIVRRLTEQFTAHESSSVTYERAGQFMEAVIYCIAHWDYEMENCINVVGGINQCECIVEVILWNISRGRKSGEPLGR